MSSALFLFTAYAFAAYIGVRTRWMQLHLATRIIYAPLALIGYAADWLFGATVLSIYFLELPDLTEATISQRTQKHFWDSKLAAFIFSQICILDPGHIGGIPPKP